MLIAGTGLGKLNEVGLTKLRRSTIDFVFQSYNLLPALTVVDNVALPLRLAGQRPPLRGARVLAEVGLEVTGPSAGRAVRRPAAARLRSRGH